MFRRKTETQIPLREALRGCEAGRVQSVGYMQVIPLVSEMTDDRFVSPSQVDAKVYTTQYGTLGFENPSDSVMIVPCHAGYVVKQHAQDHAMAHSGVVAASGNRRYNTAMCIQAAQGGLIKSGQYKMLILPHSLRERALDLRETKQYSKLWEDIAAFNRSLGVREDGHLEYFLKHFQKELDEFVAEFECVRNQIGAIILIDDRVVGIERAPSHDYWRSIWPSLIRECYGSLAIEVARSKGDGATPPQTRTPLPRQIETIEELESLVAEIARQEDEQARALVRQLLDESVKLTREESVAGVTIETAASDHFAGQVIRDGQRVVYVSLPATKDFMKEQVWTRAKEFSL